MEMGKFGKLFYNKDSFLPLLFPLPVLVGGQAATYYYHLALRIKIYGSADYKSYWDLPKTGVESFYQEIILVTLYWGTIGLAAVLLLLSDFSFQKLRIRIPYVIVMAAIGVCVILFMGLSCICKTGIDCL